MNGDDTAQLIWGIGALVLVGSSLLARRMPLGQSLKMALAWVAIFGVVFVLFLFRGEAGAVWERATADLRGDSGTVSGGTLRVPMAEDGHFWVRATINGSTTRFLIDSGATTTTISSGTARAAGVEIGGGFPVIVQTANGTAEARRARIERLVVGPIIQGDAPVLVSEALGDTNLLGMSFLSKLRNWRVEGATLVLEP